jgi:hypothetical protein
MEDKIYRITNESKSSYMINNDYNDNLPGLLSFAEAIVSLPKSCIRLQLEGVSEDQIVLPDRIRYLLIGGLMPGFKSFPKKLELVQFWSVEEPEKGLPKSFKHLKHFREFIAGERCYISKLPIFPSSTKIINIWELSVEPKVKKITLKLPKGIEKLHINTDGSCVPMKFPDLAKYPKLKVLSLSHVNITHFPKTIANKKINIKFERIVEIPEIWKTQAKKTKVVRIGSKWPGFI